MGLLDGLAGMLDGAGGQGARDILSGLLEKGAPGASSGVLGSLLGGGGGDGGGPAPDGEAAPTGPGPGGLAGMLEQLAANGLGDHVSSWLSNNPNLPVSPDQIREALGSQQVRDVAARSGLPVGDFLDRLAEHLPQAASEQAGTDPG